MVTEHLRGHAIELEDGEYVFSDTKEPTATTWKSRPCGYCGKYNTAEGHDGCLGTLPGVMNACCGHGYSDPYVQLMDGFCVRGDKASNLINFLKDVRVDDE